jgi:hypothetical protein
MQRRVIHTPFPIWVTLFGMSVPSQDHLEKKNPEASPHIEKREKTLMCGGGVGGGGAPGWPAECSTANWERFSRRGNNIHHKIVWGKIPLVAEEVLYKAQSTGEKRNLQ